MLSTALHRKARRISFDLSTYRPSEVMAILNTYLDDGYNVVEWTQTALVLER